LPNAGPQSTNAPLPDADDAWRVSEPFTNGVNALKQTARVSPTLWMDMTADAPFIANRDIQMRFKVRDVILRPVRLKHYMGMGGHLILRRDDGSVFTHLHPNGSFSMVAQQLFELRADGKAPLKVASAKNDPICKLPEFDPTMKGMAPHDSISFPYAFPKAGSYRLWVQVKVQGDILTGVFDIDVAPAQTARYASAGSSR
jgi:hypothetical protein